jgi:hypothetical protein
VYRFIVSDHARFFVYLGCDLHRTTHPSGSSARRAA